MTTLALFGFFASLAIGFGAVVAFSREIFRAAFALMGCLIGVAGITALLGAVSVAALHIMIYVGGIFVLFLFAILVTERPGFTVFRRQPAATVLAAIFALIVGALLVEVALSPALRPLINPGPESMISARAIGHALMNESLLLFEAISVLLLAGMTAAVVIMRKEIS